MIPLQPSETEVNGTLTQEGRLVFADENLRRIDWLIKDTLEEAAIGNWCILYRDKSDGRFWEKHYPFGEMHGGGPPSLRLLSRDEAERRYSLSFAYGHGFSRAAPRTRKKKGFSP